MDEYLRAFRFTLRVEGEDIGLVSADLIEQDGVTRLIMRTGVIKGTRRLRAVGERALLKALIHVTSLDRDNAPLERIVFATSAIEKYVYGRWDAGRSEVLLEELHLLGSIVRIS